MRRAVWARLLAVLAASVFALVPIVQAFCATLPPPANSALVAGHHADDPAAGGHLPDPCCGDPLTASAAAPAKYDVPAAVAKSTLDHPSPAFLFVLAALPRVAARTRVRAAGWRPEPRFRRLMRLLA
jgi:hypothetical protein